MFQALKLEEAARLMGVSTYALKRIGEGQTWMFCKPSTNKQHNRYYYYINRQSFYDFITNEHRELVPDLEKRLKQIQKGGSDV